jgi:D-aspartate ligase
LKRRSRANRPLLESSTASEKYNGRNALKATNHSRFDGAGAIVIGGDYQGLGIVRSLGRRGVPVCVIDDERSIARHSRFTALSQLVPSLLEAKDTVKALLECGRAHQLCGWVLYPTRDEQVATLSQNREELSAIFRVPTPPWETVKWLWDKRNTYSLAQRLGIPTPRTWYPRGVSDLAHIDGNFPLAIKPAIKEHFIYATKQKAWRADSPAQLRELFERASRHLPADEIMIQDLIPGDGSSQYAYCAFFKNGNSIASLTACRRRQHPLEFGRSSTYVETVDLPILEEQSQRFLRAIDYYGLVEVEYKRDLRDGQYRLLDVNGRTWGYHSIGRASGVDFPYLLFADQMNEPVESCSAKVGVRWIRLLTDLPTGALGILNGQIGVRSYLRTLLDYDEEAVFSLKDPLPGLAEIALLPYLYAKRGF